MWTLSRWASAAGRSRDAQGAKEAPGRPPRGSCPPCRGGLGPRAPLRARTDILPAEIVSFPPCLKDAKADSVGARSRNTGDFLPRESFCGGRFANIWK